MTSGNLGSQFNKARASAGTTARNLGSRAASGASSLGSQAGARLGPQASALGARASTLGQSIGRSIGGAAGSYGRGAAESAMVVRVRDLATKSLQSIGATAIETAHKLNTLRSVMTLLGVTGTSLVALIPVITTLLAAMITTVTMSSLYAYEKAVNRARLQLRSMGLDLETTNRAIENVSENLDRATSTTFLQSIEALELMAAAGINLSEQLLQFAEDFERRFGIPVEDTFKALAEAKLLNDPQPIIDLLSAVDGLGIELSELEGKDFNEIIEWLQQMSDENKIGAVNRLADALSRFYEATRQPREKITAETSALAAIVVETLATQLEQAIKNAKTSFIAALLSSELIKKALTNWKNTGAFKSIAGGILGGIAAAIAAIGIGGIIESLTALLENPETIVAIAIAAAALGVKFGRWWVSAIIGILGFILAPGLATYIKELSDDTKLMAAGIGLGYIIGKRLNLGFMRTLALGFILGDVLTNIGIGSTEFNWVKVAAMAAGAALGLYVSGPFGAVVGAGIGAALSDSFEDPEMLSGIRHWIVIATLMLDNFFIAIGKLLFDLLVKNFWALVQEIALGAASLMENIPGGKAIADAIREDAAEIQAALNAFESKNLKFRSITPIKGEVPIYDDAGKFVGTAERELYQAPGTYAAQGLWKALGIYDAPYRITKEEVQIQQLTEVLAKQKEQADAILNMFGELASPEEYSGPDAFTLTKLHELELLTAKYKEALEAKDREILRKLQDSQLIPDDVDDYIPYPPQTLGGRPANFPASKIDVTLQLDREVIDQIVIDTITREVMDKTGTVHP